MTASTTVPARSSCRRRSRLPPRASWRFPTPPMSMCARRSTTVSNAGSIALSDFAMAQHMLVQRIIESGVAKGLRIEHPANQDQRGSRELGGSYLRGDGRERPANDLLIGPGDAIGDNDWTVGAVMGSERALDIADVADGKVNGKSAPRSPERFEGLVSRHRRGLHCGTRQDDGLRNFGQRELGLE